MGICKKSQIAELFYKEFIYVNNYRYIFCLQGCATPEYPGVNMEVSYFVDWIHAKVDKM